MQENNLFGIDRPNGSLSNKKVVIEPSNEVEDFVSRQMNKSYLSLFQVVIKLYRTQEGSVQPRENLTVQNEPIITVTGSCAYESVQVSY